MRPASPSLPERDFTFDALAQGLRVDGRGLLDGREIEVTFGEELGSVECSMGQTRYAVRHWAWYFRVQQALFAYIGSLRKWKQPWFDLRPSGLWKESSRSTLRSRLWLLQTSKSAGRCVCQLSRFEDGLNFVQNE